MTTALTICLLAEDSSGVQGNVLGVPRITCDN